MRRGIASTASIVLGVALLAGCAAATPAPTPTTAPASPTPAPLEDVSKVLVIVLENHALEQVVAKMPQVMDTVRDFSYATEFTAIRHPSLPNYLAMLGGSTFKVTDDKPPTVHKVAGPSVFGQAIAVGATAKLYAEGMTGTCQRRSHGDYAVKHNPWAYFVDERDLCEQFDVPFDELADDIAAGDLPNLGMVVPDLCSDAHDCPLHHADGWFQDRLDELMAGADFRSGRLAIIVTADEDDRLHGNKILTAVIHHGSPPEIVTTPLTLYSITRLYADVVGVVPPRHAAEAESMSDAFHLTLAG
ncbi:MAG TPA: alkaline phosphatase family protein [Pseudolysinimonas sp.]